MDRNEEHKSKKYFQQSAEDDYDLAFAEYASILYLDQKNIEEAEIWFQKAEEEGHLSALYVYTYGMLLIEGKKESERGQNILIKLQQKGAARKRVVGANG